jgi:hypothetical protein
LHKKQAFHHGLAKGKADPLLPYKIGPVKQKEADFDGKR